VLGQIGRAIGSSSCGTVSFQNTALRAFLQVPAAMNWCKSIGAPVTVFDLSISIEKKKQNYQVRLVGKTSSGKT